MDTGEETANILFRAILKRLPKPAEVQACQTRLSRGDSTLDIAKWVHSSQEAQARDIKLAFPPGHFYSPIVDPSTVSELISEVRRKPPETLDDVKIDINEMSHFWHKNLQQTAAKTNFPATPFGAFRYGFENPAFSYADAIVLRAMIHYAKPEKIIEIGSGWSTACTLDTLQETGLSTSLTCIDPFPQLVKSLMREEDSRNVIIIPSKIQQVDVNLFDSMAAGDILFIDSTHVVKTGSDVLFELSNILPRLAKGVYIHFHDIFYPFEYGYDWTVKENRSWNEVYMLRAFLAYNSSFQVVFFNDMFAQLQQKVLEIGCPLFLKNTGGSIWLKRVA